MKARDLNILLTLSLFSGIALAQRTAHPETKTPAPAATTHTEAASESSTAEHKPAPSSHSTSAAARFQKVSAALKLSDHQQKSIATLVQGAREELGDIRANQNLTPAQQQQAEQRVNLTLAQKFVGLLSPQQKKDLETLLLKRKQNGSNANANSASNSGTSSGGGPDIPSIDAPSGSDSGNSDSSSSSSNSSSSSSLASSSDASKTDSTSTNGTATAAGSTSSSTLAAGAATAPAMVKVSAPSPAGAPAKPGRLTDAQLAAILDSFVQDESEDSGTKATAHGSGSGAL